VEIRVKNALRSGDVMATGQPVGKTTFPASLELVAEKIGWKEKKTKGIPYRGIGFACVSTGAGVRAAGVAGWHNSIATVKIAEDASVSINTGGTEIGQGLDTMVTQIAAEVLGAPVENITVAAEDTDHSVLEAGMYGSRGTPFAGNSVKAAAEDARNQLAEVAAGMLEVSAEDLEFRDNKVSVRGSPERNVSLLDVVRTSYYTKGQAIVGRGQWSPPQDMPHESYDISQAVEVEVDPETGRVTVLNSVAADELGQPINPVELAGQLEGGTVAGIGQALYEEVLWDEKGRPLNPNFLDYKMPTPLDAPTQEVHHLINPSEVGPFGAKGGGEMSTSVGLGAVANAISNATGVYFHELPITPQKILKALKEKEGRSTS
jgi:CO/xanthine dehydrogenase Mo-binding subunit